MKKLIVLMLIIALAIPVIAFAVDGDSPYYGQWIGQKHGSTGKYSEILYYLDISKYTTSTYFVFYLYNGGGLTQAKVSDSDAYADHWEIVDRHISVPTSPISAIEVYYDKETDTLYTDEWPKITFVRIP